MIPRNVEVFTLWNVNCFTEFIRYGEQILSYKYWAAIPKLRVLSGETTQKSIQEISLQYIQALFTSKDEQGQY